MSSPLNTFVDRTLLDRTAYLCTEYCRVVMRKMHLSGGNHKHLAGELSVTRWHKEDGYSSLNFCVKSGAFDLSQDLTPDEARAFAAALVLAADEFDAHRASQQQVAEVQP